MVDIMEEAERRKGSREEKLNENAHPCGMPNACICCLHFAKICSAATIEAFLSVPWTYIKRCPRPVIHF